jgi:hypothetical protein
MADVENLELRFESGGKTYSSEEMLTLEGFEASDYVINLSDNATYDGGSVSGVKVAARPLYIEIQESEEVSRRRQWLTFFNPKKEGILYVTRGDTQRMVSYRVQAFEVEQPHLQYPPVLKIDLICPDPYFYDIDDFGKNIASRRALYGFPFIWPVSKGLISDYKVFTDETLILNKGDVETGLIVDFKCTGAVTNPKIELVNTGQYMRVLRTMAAGDTIQFETNTARKNIYVNSQKYTNFDPASTFFSLAEGENILRYGSDTGYTSLDAYVRYRAKYLAAWG